MQRSDIYGLLATFYRQEVTLKFLQQIKACQQYRYVVLDAPPILLSSETHAMADYVDASILVIRSSVISLVPE